MKKFIALLISASVIAAPVAFASDEPAASQDAAVQQMTGNDSAPKPVTKGRRVHHCAHKQHRHRHTSPAKKAAEPAPAEQQ